jgi:hypothetical protein
MQLRSIGIDGLTIGGLGSAPWWMHYVGDGVQLTAWGLLLFIGFLRAAITWREWRRSGRRRWRRGIER